MSDESLQEEKQPETPSDTHKGNGSKTGILILVILFIIIFGASIFGYFALSNVNEKLANRVATLKQETGKSGEDIQKLQTLVDALQKASQKSETLSQQQEQIISEWRAAQRGDLNKWHVAEAQYLVNLANDHLQYTHNVSLAKVLLERADQVLQNMQDESVLEIRKSIASDLTNIQATQALDVTSLYLRLSGLNDQINQLPLPINPLKSETSQAKKEVQETGLPWWKVGLNRTTEALSKIVIVRYNDSNKLPLVFPEEKTFLYQNLHAEMESAMWAVLHRNAEVYQASLGRVMTWVQQYFVQDASETKNMLQTLQELRKVNIQPPVINLSTTLQLFDQYSAKETATH